MNPEAPQSSESERLKSLAGEYFDYFILDFGNKTLRAGAAKKLQELKAVIKAIHSENAKDKIEALIRAKSALISQHAQLMDEMFSELRPFLKYGSLIAFGRKGSLSADTEQIGADLWDHLVFRYFKDNTVTSKDGTLSFYGVRVYWHENSPATVSPVAHEADKPKEILKNQGGRPPKFRWDDIIDCLMLILAEKGLPETQMEMLEFVRQASRDSGHKKPPEDSWIRETIGTRFPKFFIKSKALR